MLTLRIVVRLAFTTFPPFTCRCNSMQDKWSTRSLESLQLNMVSAAACSLQTSYSRSWHCFESWDWIEVNESTSAAIRRTTRWISWWKSAAHSFQGALLLVVSLVVPRSWRENGLEKKTWLLVLGLFTVIRKRSSCEGFSWRFVWRDLPLEKSLSSSAERQAAAKALRWSILLTTFESKIVDNMDVLVGTDSFQHHVHKRNPTLLLDGHL